MNLNQLINDVHQNSIIMGNFDCPDCVPSQTQITCPRCNGTSEYCDVDNNLETIYTKLFSALKLYREKKFSDIDKFEFENERSISHFKSCFTKNILNTFEGELTELLFIAFDLMGYMLNDNIIEPFDIEDFSSVLGIEEELTFFAVRLEELKYKKIDKAILYNELMMSIKRIFFICKYEGIGIKTHIRLNLLYSFRQEEL